MAELSLWLDSYDDIYSDFDARTLLKRRVSEDFIHELGIAFRRREENTRIFLLRKKISSAENLILANSLRLEDPFQILLMFR